VQCTAFTLSWLRRSESSTRRKNVFFFFIELVPSFCNADNKTIFREFATKFPDRRVPTRRMVYQPHTLNFGNTGSAKGAPRVVAVPYRCRRRREPAVPCGTDLRTVLANPNPNPPRSARRAVACERNISDRELYEDSVAYSVQNE